MKKYLLIFLTLSFLAYTAQEIKYADKEFYLIDSLILDDLSKPDLNTIDSCLAIYHKSTIDSTKWEVLNFIASNIRSENWYHYQKIATQIIDQKLKTDLNKKEKKAYLLKKANNLNNEGYWIGNKGELHKSIKLYEEAIEILRKYKEEKKLASKLYNLATNYIKIGNINKAIPLFEESIIIAKKTNNNNTALFIANLALQYNNIGRTDEAIKFLTEALRYDKINSNEVQKAVIYTNLGILSKENAKDYSQAIGYFNKSLSIYQKLNDKRLTAQTLNKLGNTLLATLPPDTSIALRHLNKALLLAHEVKDIRTISSIYNTLGQVYYSSNKIDSSLLYAKQAYHFAKLGSSTNNIKLSSSSLSKIYFSKNNFKKAYLFHVEYKNMEDSLNSHNANFALAKTEAKLQYIKEKELSEIQHSNELALKQNENEKQSLYKRGFIFGSVILLVIMIFILIQFSKSIKQKRIIQESNTKLAEQHKEITSSITYAKRIQNAILPPIKTIETVFANSFVLYSPKDIVSGDFYWLEESGNKIHFAVADCTGHGVPGAMVSVICNNGLNRSVREHNLVQPNQILDKTREIIIKEFEKSGENIKDGMDISLINIDKTNNLLEFSGAHNSAWIIRKKENSHQLIELKGDKQPVGNFEKHFPFNNQHFDLLKGDTIYLYSDGYADQFGGPKNKKIKSVNFKKLLLEIQDLDLKIQKEKLQNFFIDWKGDYEQLDDVCVVGIRI